MTTAGGHGIPVRVDHGDDEQVKALRNATDKIQLRDEQGNLLVSIARPFSDERIADALERAKSDGPWYTTEEVINRLKSLEQQ